MAVNKPEYVSDEAGNRFEIKYVIMNPDTKEFYNQKRDEFTSNMAAATTDRYAEWAFNALDNKTDEQIDGLVAVGTYRDDNNRVHPISMARQFNAEDNDISAVDAHELFPNEVLLDYDNANPQPLRHLDMIKYDAEDVSSQYDSLGDLNFEGLDDHGLQQ